MFSDDESHGPEGEFLYEGYDLPEKDDEGDGSVEEEKEDDEAGKPKSEVADLKAILTLKTLRKLCFGYADLEYKIANLENKPTRTSAQLATVRRNHCGDDPSSLRFLGIIKARSSGH